MASDPNQQIIGEINKDISIISKRMNLIIRKADEIEAEINKRDVEWRKTIELFDYQVSLLKQDKEILKNNLKQEQNAIAEIIENFRSCVKKSIYDEFKERLEHFNITEMITEEQFKKLLKDKCLE